MSNASCRASRNDRSIVITGLGIISSIGSTTAAVTQSLREGRSGISIDNERCKHAFRSPLTGKVRGFETSHYDFTRKMLRTMCEPARYAYAAASDAIADAGLDRKVLHSPRVGLVFGNDSCVKPSVESIDIVREHGSTHFIGAGHIFRSMNSTASMNLASLLGIQGANWTMSAACASSAHAIGQAVMLIRSGLQDVVIVGGAQETNWQSMAAFDAMGAFSTFTDNPQQASRPFDAERDGLVPSGGGACLVLESREHAAKRGADIYGIVRGYGFSSDGSGHLFCPSDGGTRLAMEMALADAGVSADAIDYVNAHATSTMTGDLAEAKAIASVLGTQVPVSSTKSMTGHECWMAGASEAVYTALMAKEGFIAPNINFNRLGEDSPPIHVVGKVLEKQIKLAVSNSFGFGGTNAVLVFEYNSQ